MRKRKEKKGALVMIGILIILCGCLLGISMTIRSLLVSTIGESGIDRAVSHRMMDAIVQEAGIEDNSWLLDIQISMEKSEEVKQITGKLLDEMTASIKEGNEFEGIELSEDLEALIEKTALYIKDENPNIEEELLERLKAELRSKKADIGQIVNEYAQNRFYYVNHMSGIGSRLVKLYTVLESGWFRSILIILLAACVFMKFRLSASLSRALAYLGMESAVTSAAFILLMGAAGNRIMMSVSNRFLGRTMMLNVRPLLIAGTIFLAAGIVLILTSSILKIVSLRKEGKKV